MHKEGDATHKVQLSPGRGFFLDVASRCDMAPVACLRCACTGERKTFTVANIADANAEASESGGVGAGAAGAV